MRRKVSEGQANLFEGRADLLAEKTLKCCALWLCREEKSAKEESPFRVTGPDGKSLRGTETQESNGPCFRVKAKMAGTAFQVEQSSEADGRSIT